MVNGVAIASANLHIYVVTADGRAFTAISVVERSIGIPMLTTYPVGGIMGWLFAKVDSPGVSNGFMITGNVVLTYRTDKSEILLQLTTVVRVRFYSCVQIMCVIFVHKLFLSFIIEIVSKHQVSPLNLFDRQSSGLKFTDKKQFLTFCIGLLHVIDCLDLYSLKWRCLVKLSTTSALFLPDQAGRSTGPPS